MGEHGPLRLKQAKLQLVHVVKRTFDTSLETWLSRFSRSHLPSILPQDATLVHLQDVKVECWTMILLVSNVAQYSLFASSQDAQCAMKQPTVVRDVAPKSSSQNLLMLQLLHL